MTGKMDRNYSEISCHLVIQGVSKMTGQTSRRSSSHPNKEIYIQSVSRLVDITAGGDFLRLYNQKSSYKHVSDFGRLRSYDPLKLRIEGNDY